MEKKLAVSLLVAAVAVVLLAVFLRAPFFVSGGGGENWPAVCARACANVPESQTAPAISAYDLDAGWYYGDLGQRKPGTPASWLHSQGGTRSAAWYDPSRRPSTTSTSECDCAGRM